MARVKKPAKGVAKFNVKMSHKSLKKIFKKKKDAEASVHVDAVMEAVETQEEPVVTDEQILREHETEETSEKLQKKNPDRLKKHEMPVHVPFNDKFKKGKRKKASKADKVNPTNIVQGRLVTKKKAKKLLRTAKREERQTQRTEMQMDM